MRAMFKKILSLFLAFSLLFGSPIAATHVLADENREFKFQDGTCFEAVRGSDNILKLYAVNCIGLCSALFKVSYNKDAVKRIDIFKGDDAVQVNEENFVYDTFTYDHSYNAEAQAGDFDLRLGFSQWLRSTDDFANEIVTSAAIDGENFNCITFILTMNEGKAFEDAGFDFELRYVTVKTADGRVSDADLSTCPAIVRGGLTYSGVTYYERSGCLTVIDCPNDVDAEFEIPAEILEKPVAAVGGHAFDGCIFLTSIHIPDSIILVGRNAFEGCGSLKDVYYSGSGDSLEKLGVDLYDLSQSGINFHFASRTVIWNNFDGAELKRDENVLFGTEPEYNGEAPKRPATVQYTYIFDGWSSEINPVSGEITYTAKFKEEPRGYTVVWSNFDGTELERDEDVLYGTLPEYNGEIPKRPADAENSYIFENWTPEISKVTDNITHVATFTAFSAGVSGFEDTDKLSRQEIKEILTASSPCRVIPYYEEEPSVTAPYQTGSLSETLLLSGVERLNAIRKLAGLYPVISDSASNELSQYGAVLTAANDKLSHYPPKPGDMEDSFYQKGCISAASGNLAGMWDWGAQNSSPPAAAVDMFMNDSDSRNILNLEHRLWQLNPNLTKVGFGVAEVKKSSAIYVTEYSSDYSEVEASYDFIAWPASGNFPNELFGSKYAWNVTLNREIYQEPIREELTVTVTSHETEKTWVLSGKNSCQSDAELYFNLSGYTVIFRPDIGEAYHGIYTVRIDGLHRKNGLPVNFSYDVNFFSMEDVGDMTNNYAVTWDIDGMKIIERYTPGETIKRPVDLEKDGFVFCGWTPAVPDKMPAKNLEFTALFEAENGQLAYNSSGDGVVLTSADKSIAGAVAVTQSVKGKLVTEIGKSAFENCTELTGVILPAHLTKIAEGAFNGCKNLMSVEIPVSVKTVEENAFDGCAALTDIYFEGTKDEWNDIEFAAGNDRLEKAIIHFNTDTKRHYIAGDPDGDGECTAADARMALRVAVGLEPGLHPGRQIAADVDGTPGINAADARLILRVVVGLDSL